MDGTFEEWFNENRHSDELNESYNEYAFELKQEGGKPKSFRAWAKEVYDALKQM